MGNLRGLADDWLVLQRMCIANRQINKAFSLWLPQGGPGRELLCVIHEEGALSAAKHWLLTDTPSEPSVKLVVKNVPETPWLEPG